MLKGTIREIDVIEILSAPTSSVDACTEWSTGPWTFTLRLHAVVAAGARSARAMGRSNGDARAHEIVNAADEIIILVFNLRVPAYGGHIEIRSLWLLWRRWGWSWKVRGGLRKMSVILLADLLPFPGSEALVIAGDGHVA